MKTHTIIYCGEDGEAARKVAASIREDVERNVVMASGLMDVDPMPCDYVVVMGDIPAWRRDQIEAVYPGKVEIALTGDGGGDHLPEISASMVLRPEDMPPRRGRPPGSKNKAA